MSAIFPRWTNALPTVLGVGTVAGLTSVIAGFWYWATPKFFDVGYMPTQPGGGFSHQIHAGKLGMDCRYCHTKIEKSSEANIPNVATCYGCHQEGHLAILTTSDEHKAKTDFIREAYATDTSIPWRRVHKVPDYVRNFPHQTHLRVGVSCYSCHGRIDTMPQVYQAMPLSMGFCLECHRDPAPNLVDPKRVTDLQYVEETLGERVEGKAVVIKDQAKMLMDSLHVNAPQNCGACHY